MAAGFYDVEIPVDLERALFNDNKTNVDKYLPSYPYISEGLFLFLLDSGRLDDALWDMLERHSSHNGKALYDAVQHWEQSHFCDPLKWLEERERDINMSDLDAVFPVLPKSQRVDWRARLDAYSNREKDYSGTSFYGEEWGWD